MESDWLLHHSVKMFHLTKKTMKKSTVKFLLMGLMIFGAALSYAQPKTITGKVTDAESGNPLPGVNVLIKGSNIGTNTDLDGRYSIKVESEKAVLVFSFIGMETVEVAVKKKNIIDVQMNPDHAQLSEVVITTRGKIARDFLSKKHEMGIYQVDDMIHTYAPIMPHIYPQEHANSRPLADVSNGGGRHRVGPPHNRGMRSHRAGRRG
jgi:Ca-activated chloride channel homolog